MGSSFQQQSLRRKIVYTVLILVLFTGTLILRQVNTAIGSVPLQGIDAQARNLELREESLGEVELTGSALRVSLVPLRGGVICYLWYTATQKQKKQQWNELEMIVRVLTKLQPHFITPWLFQSWNLAYNVSVESDRIRDKYFYMTRGIELLAEGERQNRDNPDLRFSMGFTNQHKIGLSDEANTLRCLYEMSTIDPIERDPERFQTTDANDNRVIDLDKFQKFCQKHPMLVRRLREVLKKNTPADVLDFLKENSRIPSRFEEKMGSGASADERTPLLPEDQQFPALPPREGPQGVREVADPSQPDFDNFMVARDWYSYSIEPMPPAQSEPGPGAAPIDPRRYHMPKYMAPIIFRGYPARGQSFVAEYLERDGWFDDKGWRITGNWFNDDKFPDGRDAVVGEGTAWGQRAWQKAHDLWRTHGVSNGLYFSPEDMKDLEDKAKVYRDKFNVKPGDRMVGLPVGQHEKGMRESYQAHVQLAWYDHFRTLTNFPYFYFRSQVEMDARAVAARKALFEAEQYRKSGDRQLAIAKYQAALPIWRELMIQHRGFSREEVQQEDIFEYVVRYMEVAQELYGERVKKLLVLQDFLMQSANRPPIPVGWLPPGYLTPQVHPNIATPMDGTDTEGQPLISDSAKLTVRERLHLPQMTGFIPENLRPATPKAPNAEQSDGQPPRSGSK